MTRLMQANADGEVLTGVFYINAKDTEFCGHVKPHRPTPRHSARIDYAAEQGSP